jgi:pimeloyl-ACP methyl ester carboxylesterase
MTATTATNAMDTMTAKQPPTRFLQIDSGINSSGDTSGRIAYDDAGRGPVVLCTPGLGDNRTSFRHLRPLLVEAGYRVVTMDLRGQGESSIGWDDYSTPAMAADILALARHLDAGPVVLVSNSYTGGPSFLASSEAPELFAGLVMTSPFARPQPPMSPIMRAGEAVVTHVAASWIAYWSSLFKTHKPQDFVETRKALAASLREPGRMAALRAMNDSSQAPGAAAAAAVDCPVLVVMGSRDPDFKDPAAEGAAVAGLVRDGRLHVVEGAGHYPHAEFPAETAEIVLTFLRELKQPATA